VKISMHTMAIDTFVPMLRSLSEILDKGAQHARAKKLDPASLVNARLATDMYPLVKQVQLACDQAKNTTARLMGTEPPRSEDNEKTFDELKARIATTEGRYHECRGGSLVGSVHGKQHPVRYNVSCVSPSKRQRQSAHLPNCDHISDQNKSEQRPQNIVGNS
jgi:hypothetical protein